MTWAMTMATWSGRWSRGKNFPCDFNKATLGRIANANTNGGSVLGSIARKLYAGEDEYRGAVDDPLEPLWKVVTNGLSWFRLDDCLEEGEAVRTLNVLSWPPLGVYERCHHFGEIAKCVGNLIG